MGEALGRAACPGDIFGLIGPLGAGKSCFARGIARGLDVTGPVPSPTFTLCREYPAARLLFHHWDFYRLQDAEELESTAFTDSLDSGAVIAAEWADLFRAELPAKRTTWIHVDRLEDENRRRVRIEFAPGSLALRRAWAEETGGHCEA